MPPDTPLPPELVKAEIRKLSAEEDFYKESALKARETARLTGMQANSAELEWREIKASEYENHIYSFNGAVNQSSAQDFIRQMGQWTRHDNTKDITVIFNSPGGGVFDGLAIYDYIKELQRNGTKVHTVGLGMAASMGGILLQAGDTRAMANSAFMLIHEISTGAIGSVSQLEDATKFAQRLQDRLLSILSERSKFSDKQIKRRWERKDWWLGAQEALEYGFIDEIH